MITKIFISYARVDGIAIATRLYLDLERNGFVPWMDQRGGIALGERFDEKIQTAIDECDIFILIMTQGSVRINGFCRQELAYALENAKRVIPLKAEDCTAPVSISTYNRIDFREDYDQALIVLIEALKTNDFGMLDAVTVSSPGEALKSYSIENDDVIVVYPQSLPIRPRRLPPRIVGSGGLLFGRSTVFSKCVEVLCAPHPEPLIIQGMGGVGKSTLAAALGWGLLSYFPGGIIWIDSKNITLSELYDKVGRAFEDENISRLPVDEKAFRVRELLNRRKTLVILDGMESRDVIRSFKTECATDSLIVTTRERYAGLGRLIELTPLPDTPATALFLAVSQITDSVSQSRVLTLVQMLGGHPQAIVIAASLCLQESLSLDDMFEMLNSSTRRISSLKLGSQTEDNILATFDSSYLLLSESEKQLFRLIGMSWSKRMTAEMLILVTDEDENVTSSALRGLVRHSLLYTATDKDGIRAFHIYDLLHDYANALASLEQQEMSRLRNKWLSGVAKFSARHSRSDQSQHYDALEAELKNIVDAANWAVQQEFWSDVNQIVLSLCVTSNMMSERGYSLESVSLLEYAIVAARRLGKRNHEGMHLGALGSTYIDLSDYSKAIEYLEKARTIHLDLKDTVLVCKWTGMLGTAYGDLGVTEKAIEFLSEAVRLVRKTGSKLEEGYWLGWLGNAYRDKGEFNEAKSHLLAAISMVESIKHPIGIIMWRGNYARTLAWSGDAQTGLSYCETNPETAEMLKQPRLKAWALLFLSECLWGIGRTEEAYSKAFEGLKIMEKIVDRDGSAEIQHNLGSWYLRDGNVAFATSYLLAAEKLRISMGHGDLGKTQALLKTISPQ